MDIWNVLNSLEYPLAGTVIYDHLCRKSLAKNVNLLCDRCSCYCIYWYHHCCII